MIPYVILRAMSIFGATPATGGACNKDTTLLGIIPTWYKYLPDSAFDPTNCIINIDIQQNPEQLWLIGFGVIDILLRLAGLVAVGFVIYGGFRFVTSQGEAEGIKAARSTIINALIGLVITIFASTIITFIAGRIN